MRTFDALLVELRQLRQPRAFRIDGTSAFGEGLLADVGPPPPDDRPPPDDKPPPGPPLDEKSLADAATNLWRAQRRLARGDGPRDRQTGRYLLTCREALTDAGLVVQDHDGDPYHPGRSLEVLAFQEEPGATAEVIVETVRPTVYLLDRRIQMGQVIVAVPSDRTSTQE